MDLNRKKKTKSLKKLHNINTLKKLPQKVKNVYLQSRSNEELEYIVKSIKNIVLQNNTNKP